MGQQNKNPIHLQNVLQKKCSSIALEKPWQRECYQKAYLDGIMMWGLCMCKAQPWGPGSIGSISKNTSMMRQKSFCLFICLTKAGHPSDSQYQTFWYMSHVSWGLVGSALRIYRFEDTNQKQHMCATWPTMREHPGPDVNVGCSLGGGETQFILYIFTIQSAIMCLVCN